MKQYFYLAVFLISVGYTAQAQYKPYYYKNHEIGVIAKAGMSQNYGSLPTQISTDFKMSTAVGIQYDYYLNATWSLGIGGQYAMQTTTFTANNLKGNSEEVDWENEKFVFSYHGKSYKEEWKVSQLNIPLTVQYVGKGERAFYARTGIQYSLIMSNKTTVTWSGLQTSGFFPQYNLLLDQDLLYAGFAYQEQVEAKPKLDLKDRWAWIGEVGMKYNIKDNQNLYVGVYFDLGVNNQKPDIQTSKEQVLMYQPVENDALVYSSIQESSKAVFKSYNFGIQLRYGFGL